MFEVLECIICDVNCHESDNSHNDGVGITVTCYTDFMLMIVSVLPTLLAVTEQAGYAYVQCTNGLKTLNVVHVKV